MPEVAWEGTGPGLRRLPGPGGGPAPPGGGAGARGTAAGEGGADGAAVGQECGKGCRRALPGPGGAGALRPGEPALGKGGPAVRGATGEGQSAARGRLEPGTRGGSRAAAGTAG